MFTLILSAAFTVIVLLFCLAYIRLTERQERLDAPGRGLAPVLPLRPPAPSPEPQENQLAR
jgi:hypothetical protein